MISMKDTGYGDLFGPANSPYMAGSQQAGAMASPVTDSHGGGQDGRGGLSLGTLTKTSSSNRGNRHNSPWGTTRTTGA